MDLTLQRFEKSVTGIFSHLLDSFGTKLCESVTHAYQRDATHWEAKVPTGRWMCLRGVHSLDGVNKFETFEIAVPGHTNILFHKGNVEEESEGCELLGMYKGMLGAEEAVLNSKDAFDLFMKLQVGVSQFWLTVEDAPGDVNVQGASEGMGSQLDDSVQRGAGAAGAESGHDPDASAASGAISSGPASAGSLADSLGLGGLA